VLHTAAEPGQAPPLTRSQHEQVKRAFNRVTEG
jgi:type III secretion protein C